MPIRLLTVPEVAAQLRFHHDSVRKLIHRGLITAHRIGGAIRVSQDDLDAFVRQGRGVRIRPHSRKKEASVS
jgi:excisionase family DNA binding protein